MKYLIVNYLYMYSAICSVFEQKEFVYLIGDKQQSYEKKVEDI
jgi:hypothetical protein